MQTKEQIRSEFSLKIIEDKYKSKLLEEDANFIVGLPTMILTNGLGQSLAFLLSNKKKPKYEKSFLIIKEWLEHENYVTQTANTNMGFLKSLSEMSQKTYVQAQNETLAMLNWLKRYARSFQEEKENSNGSNS